MKNKITIIVLLIFAVSVFGSYSTDSLKLSMVNQDPDPVEPGKYVDVRLQVENLANQPVNGVLVEFIPSYPFTLDPGEKAMVDIGTLTSLQTDDRSIIIKYKLRVDQDAIEGTNTVKFRIKTQSGDWANYNYNVDVKTLDATLGIDSVSTTPSAIIPGGDAIVQIKLKNMADSYLKDISLKLDLTMESIATASLDALPFAPMDSGTEKKINQINPEEEITFTYAIHVYPEAESRIYKIPIVIEYYDALGTKYTTNDLIGMVVNSEPDVSAVLDDTTIESAGSKGEVSFRFINKGLTDIKFVDVILKESDAFELLGTDEVYLGNIDSDDYESAEYEIYVKDTTDKQIFLPVHYEYMDANNNIYKKDIEIRLKLLSEEDKLKYGIVQNNNNNLVIAVIIVAIVGFVIYRIVRKKKKKH